MQLKLHLIRRTLGEILGVNNADVVWWGNRLFGVS